MWIASLPATSPGNSTNLVMALEDCTTDIADMGSMQKLPNQIQLVESDLPLAEAENVHFLLGNYLFRYFMDTCFLSQISR